VFEWALDEARGSGVGIENLDAARDELEEQPLAFPVKRNGVRAGSPGLIYAP
jgi:hypothetical protein